ncbi:hypothetical protein B0H13DRAFT_2395055 [Mycena leptocephala]|nr:hypothetical protein B0H13DRAFT_2395055 [Mycena leptocephala]
MEESITRFGRGFFTKEECRQRAWPPSEADDASASAPAVPLPAPPVAATPIPPVPTSAPATSTPANPAAAAAEVGAATVLDDSVLNSLLAFDPPGSPAPADDGIDRSEWGAHLIGAHAYLSEKEWGPRWKNLLAKLVHFEWAHFHNEDGLALSAGGRPAEIGQWMKEHRRWLDQPLQEAEHGQFGLRILEYWKAQGPQDRWDGLEEGVKPKQELEDKDLLVLALAWWGQAISNTGVGDGIGGGEAALAAAGDWNFMVEELAWVLGFLGDYEDRPAVEAELAAKGALGETGAEKQAAKAKTKGKTAAEDEVEVPAAKAQRTTRARNAAKATTEEPPVQGPAPERPRPRARPRRLEKTVADAGVEQDPTNGIAVGSSTANGPTLVADSVNSAEAPVPVPDQNEQDLRTQEVQVASGDNATAMDVDSDARGAESGAASEHASGSRPVDAPVGRRAEEDVDAPEIRTVMANIALNTPDSQNQKTDEAVGEEDHPFAGFTAEELEEMMTDPEAGDDGDESS